MKSKITCKICGTEHTATARHFPAALYEREGGVPKIVGYVCFKCDRNNRRANFIKEHGIKNAAGERMSDAIRRKAEELKKKLLFVSKVTPKKENPRLLDRIKNRFQGRTRINKGVK